jgi:site-specific recombinase XerD
MPSAQLAPSSNLVDLLPARAPADRNPAIVYLSQLHAGEGRRAMRHALDAIAGYVTDGQADALNFPWPALRFQHTAALRAHLAETYAAATANRFLAALRGALKAAWRLELMTAEDYRRAVDLPRVKSETLPRGRALAAGELRALAEACGADLTPAGARDLAMLAVLYCAGLRRSELAGLDLADYNPLTGAVTVRCGKGRKDRITYIGGGSDALGAWLQARGDVPGPLFWPIRKGGGPDPRRIGAATVYRVLAKRAEQAAVRSFSPHDLRRTFISDLLDAGADLSTVQRLAGHASTATTAGYDRRPEEAKRRAAGLLHFPHIGA